MTSDSPTDSGPENVKSAVAKQSIVALTTVGLLVLIFAVCLVSAVQLLAPRDMPFGITESSPVVDAVQQEYSLDLKTYSSEADLMDAARVATSTAATSSVRPPTCW
jgi:hypothetical protein